MIITLLISSGITGITCGVIGFICGKKYEEKRNLNNSYDEFLEYYYNGEKEDDLY